MVKSVGVWLLVGALVFGLSSCGSAEDISSYNSKGIYFEYPGNWKLSQELVPLPLINASLKEICRLEDPNGGQMGILFADLPQGIETGDLLKTLYDKSPSSLLNVQNFQEAKKTLGGKDLWEIEFQIPSFHLPTQFKNWWWQFQGKLFLFVLLGESGDFPGLESKALKVVESFTVNLQEFTESFPLKKVIKGEDYALEIPEGWEVKEYPLTKPGKNPDLGTIIIWEASRRDPYQSISFQEFDFSGIKASLKSLKLQDLFRETYEAMFQRYYEGVPPDTIYFYDVKEQEIQIGDLKALAKTYTHPWGEPWIRTEDVWLEINKKVFIISFSTYPQDFESHRSEFLKILSSIQWVFKPEEKPTGKPTEPFLTPTPTLTATPTTPEETQPFLTARQAYSLIESTIFQRFPDAKLEGIFGGKFQTGEPINPDGTCLSWEFWFASPGTRITISVQNGKVGEISTQTVNKSSVVFLPENWPDSPEVIERAFQEFKRLHPEISDFRIADHGLLYEPFPVSGKGDVPAACLYIQTSNGYPFLIVLNAETLEFIKELKM